MYKAIDGKEHLKILALVPSVREQVCHHQSASYNGRMPLTGRLVCHMCGTEVESVPEPVMRCPGKVRRDGTEWGGRPMARCDRHCGFWCSVEWVEKHSA